MTDGERLTALLMAGAGDCLGKGGVLNCSKLADYLLEHGVTVTEEAEKALKDKMATAEELALMSELEICDKEENKNV